MSLYYQKLMDDLQSQQKLDRQQIQRYTELMHELIDKIKVREKIIDKLKEVNI